MPQIATLGNALVDVLTKMDSDEPLCALGLLKGGMTHISEEKYASLYKKMQELPLQEATGGSAANTALCLAHLMEPGEVKYVGKLNPTDRFGQFFARSLHAAGVDINVITAGEKSSGVCCAFVSPDGERTFATYLGAAADVQAEELSEDMFQGVRIVHLEGYLVQNHALVLRAVEMAHAAGALVSLDMASYNIVEADHAFFEHLLPQVDIVFANEEEASAWQAGTPEESLASLAALCQTAVVKLGARGAWAQRGDEQVFGTAESIAHVVDTTAAGDFFAAGFLYALLCQRSLADCLHAGAYCASRVIQVLGTQLTPSMWQDIKTTLKP